MTAQGRIGALIAVLGLTLYISTINTNRQIAEALDVSQIKVVESSLPDPIPETELLVAIDQKEFECMRANMFYEARNQKSDEAYIAVGYSVINRTKTKGYPSTMCGVIEEKKFVARKKRWVCQYSWYCDGKSDVPNLANVIERKAWERAGELALAVMKNEVDNPIGRATMYHATYVSPKWDYKKLTRVTRIETHIFYNETRTQKA